MWRLALLLLFVAVPLAAQHQDHAQDTQPVGGYTADDLLFLEHMIMHHQQAIDLQALLEGRSDRSEFKAFARLVARGQAAEIDAMRRLAAMARERGAPEPPMMDMTGDPPMTGMLSSAKMRAIANSSGWEFERLWLEGMIYHHEGAIDMAVAQQARQREEGRQPFGLEVMVEEIIESQRAEIGTMRRWLEEWASAE